MSNSRQAQVVILDPNVELTFKGPFTEFVTSNLRLTNPTQRAVYFKVKTTAPRFYCVRPNSGVIKPKETAVINVMLQPVDQQSTLENERSRHKFMIQTAYAPEGDDVENDSSGSVEKFWKSVDPTQVMDSKLRVVFQKANGETIESPLSAGAGGGGVGSPAARQPTSPTNYQEQHRGGGGGGGGGHEGEDRSALQKEIELRKMYQDEKKNLEHENRALLDKLDKLGRSAANQMAHGVEGFSTLHVILMAIFALLAGIIVGKLF